MPPGQTLQIQRPSPWALVLIACVLVLAQVLLACHQVEHLSHAAGDAGCEVCLTGGGPGGAAGGPHRWSGFQWSRAWPRRLAPAFRPPRSPTPSDPRPPGHPRTCSDPPPEARPGSRPRGGPLSLIGAFPCPRLLLRGAVAAALSIPAAALAATDPEIAELRSMINQMKSQYEGRIRNLEARLAKAEADAARPAKRSQAGARRRRAAAAAKAEPRPMTAPSGPAPAAPPAAGGAFGALTSGSAFNPQISVILDGNYYQDGIDGDGLQPGRDGLPAVAPRRSRPRATTGEAVAAEGHAHGAANNGFNFREAEIAFSATVDPYFDAVSVPGGGRRRRAWSWRRVGSRPGACPMGCRLKAGKFLSDFGYINRQHPHQWDFVDQNLPYLNLLGAHGLQDTGVQVTWLPKLPFYTLIGAELAQGDQERFGATLGEAERDAPGPGRDRVGAAPVDRLRQGCAGPGGAPRPPVRRLLCL